MIMEIKFKKLTDTATVPQYATEGSAGFDLVADSFKIFYDQVGVGQNGMNISPECKSILLTPHSRLLIGCGYAVAIPLGFQLEVRPRSGKALKEGVTVMNAPGTIDSDYRGEIGVILHNSSKYCITIEVGDKIAQAVLMPHFVASFNVVNELPETERGIGGYGSTDKKKETINY